MQFPAYAFKMQQIGVNDYLRPGDPIEIGLGYNEEMVREFTGYVAEVKAGVPVEITCQDEMYLLKRRPVKCSYGSVTVRQLLHDICPAGTRLNAINADLGHFRAVNVTVAKVLEKLKEQYGFVSYYRNGILYCGRVYHEPRTRQPAMFQFEWHILDNQLSYRSTEHLKFIVKATNHGPKDKKMEVTVGDLNDPAAEQRTLQYYGLRSEAQLRAYAKADLVRLKKTGYEGSFTTYGLVYSVDRDTNAIITSDDRVTTGTAHYNDDDDILIGGVHYSVVELRDNEDKVEAVTPFKLVTNDEGTSFGSVQHGQVVRLVSTEYPERNGDFFVDSVKKSFSSSGYRQEITVGSAASLKGL
ncbi:MAG TPA: hypothetical protein VF630_03850 [Hymenobacter sp.]